MNDSADKPNTAETKPGPGLNALIMWAIPLAVGLVIWFIPSPAGVKTQAWHLLAIFAATIVGITVKPLPMGAMALLGITAAAVTGTLGITDALSGFGNSVIWLIVIAFFIARGFIKTGLGKRIGYIFMRTMGKKSLGLAYGLIATDLILAPAIPSNTARGGGVIYPILRSVAQAYGSDPKDGTSRKIGSFLIFASFQGLVITSAMFITAMAANSLSVKLAGQQGIEITWASWALAALVPGILSLLLVPFLIYKLYTPEIKETPGAVRLAKDKLAEMGKVTAHERIMLGTFILLLVLWIFGKGLGIHNTATALLGLSLLLLTRVLTWKDILEEKNAWDTLVWFAALVMMASYLNKLGLIPWFSETMKGLVGGIGWVPAFLVLNLVYFYSHYFFASNTAHISAMYAAFLAVSTAVGTPPVLAALVPAFFSNLFSCMTHYGTGPAPVFFGAGYVEIGTWWKLGALISVVNIIIWVVIGGLWWKVLGLW
ncbi:MAG: anion permease [bacterium]|nr:anion permease [bacterium]